MSKLRFYYDIVCPFAYVASTQVEQVAREARAELEYRPVLLGGIFKQTGAVSDPNVAMPEAKRRLTRTDARRQAELAGVELNFPAQHPRRSVAAMRVLLAAGEARQALTDKLFRAYWVDGEDISDLDVLQRLVRAFGLDVRAINADPDIRQGLFDATEHAVDLGAFGVPTFEVDGKIWWGADRLRFVGRALGLPPETVLSRRGPPRKLTFFHDFSSPFSYLASTQVERVANEAGAELEVVPFLLGALFKQIGTPIVPIDTFVEARREYQRRDMREWAHYWGVEIGWPSHFPLRTVAALRASIVEPACMHALYRAAWVEDRNIGDDAVVIDVLDAAGFDGAGILGRTKDDAVKKQLFANTARAIEAGACGAPTFVVDGRHVFWGQDRLPMVADALAGWEPPVEAA